MSTRTPHKVICNTSGANYSQQKHRERSSPPGHIGCELQSAEAQGEIVTTRPHRVRTAVSRSTGRDRHHPATSGANCSQQKHRERSKHSATSGANYSQQKLRERSSPLGHIRCELQSAETQGEIVTTRPHSMGYTVLSGVPICSVAQFILTR